MKKIIVFVIDCYRQFISQPLQHFFGGGCRFYPTCSQYTKESIEKFGVIRGGGLAIKRIIKCHPGTKFQFDFVPKQ